ncbi:DgyrCDS5173 [Dimorphilus gyrociliatus]|uniref:DgyrCDS5173 n=1 Tax=Dimorphilus gyrociliatus TaxID=2664684 RepID=A0A7I8VLR0_9ANNE|nr:DgyrCDS5173 [Dimorphilus gyrociliatus]
MNDIKTKTLSISSKTKDRIISIVYGNCIGDALGLLTEFLNKKECHFYYLKYLKEGLRYKHKIPDKHRRRWDEGDWTDDSDQMICIMQSLSQNNMISETDIAKKIFNWSRQGFPQLKDTGGLGLGRTTYLVLLETDYLTKPEESAKRVWINLNQNAAPNGGVMRTSILGIYEFQDLYKVAENTVKVCRVTHYDPRCSASCVAVTIIIAKMLQRIENKNQTEFSDNDIEEILNETYEFTDTFVFRNKEYITEISSTKLNQFRQEFQKYFFIEKYGLSQLHLDECESIGYTFKCMASGIWALKQDDPEKALTDLIMEGGDADTNGAVAGALLGCRYGLNRFPSYWNTELASAPNEFLKANIKKFLNTCFYKCNVKEERQILESTKVSLYPKTTDRITAIVYGNCIGDALGLLTEFLNKKECHFYYLKYLKEGLRYKHKIPDKHRRRWDQGDWTDDSDQMICIMQSLSENKRISETDIAKRIFNWSRRGFPELSDNCGLGLGKTTLDVLYDKYFLTEPSESAKRVWINSNQNAAPNGGVMRTSILGIYEFQDLNKVAENTVKVCRVTHYDPRCSASCVAVTIIIAKMLQRIENKNQTEFSDNDIEEILNETYEFTCKYIFENEEYTADLKSDKLDQFKADFKTYFFIKKDGLEELKLDEPAKIGYTFKCMASGIWALKQGDPEKALTDLIMEGGDADTNGAVAGALLGCRYGLNRFPKHWISELARGPVNFLEKNLNIFLASIFTIAV